MPYNKSLTNWNVENQHQGWSLAAVTCSSSSTTGLPSLRELSRTVQKVHAASSSWTPLAWLQSLCCKHNTQPREQQCLPGQLHSEQAVVCSQQPSRHHEQWCTALALLNDQQTSASCCPSPLPTATCIFVNYFSPHTCDWGHGQWNDKLGNPTLFLLLIRFRSSLPFPSYHWDGPKSN